MARRHSSVFPGFLTLLLAAAPALGGAPDWTLVADQTVISTPDQDLTRSLRRVVVNDDEALMYATFLQKSLGAGVREYTLSGDPPTATPSAFFNVTTISPSGADHQPEGLDVDDRGFVYVGSSKDSTSGDNARVIVLPTGLASNQVFVLADIDSPGSFTGESVGDVRIRKVGGTYQLYVSRHHLSSAYIERYIVGGASVGSLTLTLDASFSGDGRFNLRTEGGFPGASGLRGIDVAADGTIFVVTREDDVLYRVSSDLTTVTTVGLSNPMGVALYDGRAFVTQYNGNTSSVAEIDQATLSVLSTFDAFDDFPRDFGADGNEAGYAGIDVDSDGHVYLGDQLYFRTSAESRDRVVRSSSFAPPEPAVLSLEASDTCQGDWDDNAGNGYQVAVELWMRNLPSNVTGFQAFLEYDDSVMTYNGLLSSYTTNPFPLHITPILLANPVGGSILLDGSDSFGDPGVSNDALLATLVFNVDQECEMTSVVFDLDFPFASEVSFEGTALPTDLSDSPVLLLDNTPPVLGACTDIMQPADADIGDGCTGAVVSYSDPTATDNCGAVSLACVPPSGSLFPVGTTEVTCTATDSCGNETQCTFDVTVTATNLVDVEVELVGVFTPVSRCIHFVLDDCDATADVSLDFVDHDSNVNTPVRFMGFVEVPCGEWTQICAKDEQHTLWDTSGLVVAGMNYMTTTLLSLEPGDTDNDGDVDINDVTMVIAQFGGPEPFGGCPWDGTPGSRGADFSNNGNVGSEDYSLLASNWLAVTSCACTSPSTVPELLGRGSIPTSELEPRVARAVDFNDDGFFDRKDVELFERLTRVPNVLSPRMFSAPAEPPYSKHSSVHN